MNANIGVIEAEFNYIDQEVFSNQIPSSKMRPGFHLDNLVFDQYTKIAQRKEIKESDIFREIITRFALGHFKNKQTVNRDIYETTVSENEKLSKQIEQLTEIINKHDLIPKGQSNNRVTDGWPTNTPPKVEQSAKQNANGYANQFATPTANGFANQFATPSANGFANQFANNMASMADIHQREAAFALLFQPFAEYIQMLDMGININQLAIWLRFKIGLQ
jgi:hypothetical protein